MKPVVLDKLEFSGPKWVRDPPKASAAGAVGLARVSQGKMVRNIITKENRKVTQLLTKERYMWWMILPYLRRGNE